MDIFHDDLNFDEINFKVFYNEDDEPVEIDGMELKELKNIISTLDRELKMMPEHYNAEIWQEYRRIVKEKIDEFNQLF